MVLEETENLRKQQKLGPDRVIYITFKANTLSALSYTQTLKIEHRFYTGAQWSLFYNDKESESIHNLTWKEEYTITNEELGIQILVGGNINAGSISYIENFGFYEGGENNSYRIDPQLLYSCLTGQTNEQTWRKLIKKHKNILDQKQKELSEWIETIKQSSTDNDFQTNQIKSMVENVEKEKRIEMDEQEKIIDKLNKILISVENQIDKTN